MISRKDIFFITGLLLSILSLCAQTQSRTLGNKSYEVSNHLGNIMAVVSDRKTSTVETSNTTLAFNETDIKAFNDYYPYGMLLDNRNDAADYRFGFQGQEKDDEVKGEGNSINYKYRAHDPRLGRFFAVDPLSSKYPFNSTYAFSENNVVNSVEREGLEKQKSTDGCPECVTTIALEGISIVADFPFTNEEIISKINTEFIEPMNNVIKFANIQNSQEYISEEINGSIIRTHYRDLTSNPAQQYANISAFNGNEYTSTTELDIGVSGNVDVGVTLGASANFGALNGSASVSLLNLEVASGDLSTATGATGYYMGKDGEYKLNGGVSFSGGALGVKLVTTGATYDYSNIAGFNGDYFFKFSPGKAAKEKDFGLLGYNFDKTFKQNITKPKLKLSNSSFSGFRVGFGAQVILGVQIEVRIGESILTFEREMTRDELINLYSKLNSNK